MTNPIEGDEMTEDNTIDDTARGMPMKGAAPLAVALDLMGRKERPMACCPRDGEPLISTFEQAGAEFHCQVCHGWFGFLSPTPRDVTPELQARYDELKAAYDIDRAARRAARAGT